MCFFNDAQACSMTKKSGTDRNDAKTGNNVSDIFQEADTVREAAFSSFIIQTVSSGTFMPQTRAVIIELQF